MGDFNCVLAKTNSTCSFNYSRAPDNIVRGFILSGMWEVSPARGIFTHYSRQGATRLNRIYVSQNLRGRKVGVVTVVKKFTDHRAIIFRIALDVPLTLRGRGYWKTKTTLLRETTFQEKLRLQWARCVRQVTFYSDSHVVGGVRAEANAPPLRGRREGSKAGKNGHVKLLQCVFVRRSAKHQPP